MSSVGASGLSSKVLDLSCSSRSSWRASRWAPAHDGHTCRCVSQRPPKAVPSKGCPLRPLTGTFVSAFTVLCGARTDLPDRHVCCVFWLNIAAALIQILTAIVMVGWIMSIFWGMDMVILASE